MGITIHYKGSIRRLSEIDTLVDILEDFAKILEWKTERYPSLSVTDKQADTDAFGIQQHQDRHYPRGIVVYPHESCEPFSFTFTKEKNLVDFRGSYLQNRTESPGWLHVKTQFAPVDSHIAIIKLMKYLRGSFIPDLEVKDEGGYWESEDEKQLESRMESLNQAMGSLEEGFTVIPKDVFRNRSAEEIADLIERLLKRNRE
ncbi:MAG: hypothetical protein R6V27_07030 [Balneolaceae bacterium]